MPRRGRAPAPGRGRAAALGGADGGAADPQGVADGGGRGRVREREGRSRPGLFTRLRERAAVAASALAGARPRTALAAASVVLVVGAALGFAATQAVFVEDSQTLSAQVDRARIPSGGGSLEIPEGKDDGAVLRVHRHARADPRPHLPGVGPARRRVRSPGRCSPWARTATGAAVVTDDLTGADAVMVTRERAGGATRPRRGAHPHRRALSTAGARWRASRPLRRRRDVD